jgi:hypothetical protein
LVMIATKTSFRVIFIDYPPSFLSADYSHRCPQRSGAGVGRLPATFQFGGPKRSDPVQKFALLAPQSDLRGSL